MKKKFLIIFVLILIIIAVVGIYILNSKSTYKNLKVGDYIDYKLDYENVKEYGEVLTNYKGWRIIEIKNNRIKIISAGTPCNYELFERKSDIAINDLTNNFENATFELADGKFKKGSYFKNEFANKISILTFKEFSQIVCGKDSYDIAKYRMNDGNEKYTKYTENMKGLINNGSNYYIATHGVNDNNSVMSLVYTSGEIASSWTGMHSVRPVIELKENIKIISGNGTEESPYQISL